MSLSRSDLNNLARAYLVNRMLSSRYDGGVPFNSSGYPADVNNNALSTLENTPGVSLVGSAVPATVSASQLTYAIRQLAYYYASVVRSVYGVVGNFNWYDAYEVFYVQPGYHADHWNSVVNSINAQNFNELSGAPAQWQVATVLDRMANVILSQRDNATADLRVCHGSCHTSCHSSRGRR